MLIRYPKNLRVFVLAGFALVGLTAGCDKKSRLGDSTYSLEVNPPAAAVVKGQTLQLTAIGRAPGGRVPVSPEWSISSEQLGTLNTNIGPAVILTADELGDLTVTALFDDQIATAQIAVVTYIPSPTTFNVYNDDGLPTGATLFIFPTGTSLGLSELSSGYTPEGIHYQHAVGGATGEGWGVSTLGDQDLTEFSSGRLEFSIRLNRTVFLGEVLNVEVDDDSNAGTPASSVTLGPAVGFDRLSLDWQEISIPINSFTEDVSSMNVLFAIVLNTVTGGELQFDIDAVRWER